MSEESQHEYIPLESHSRLLSATLIWGFISRKAGEPAWGYLECFLWLLSSFTPQWHQLPMPELCQEL